MHLVLNHRFALSFFSYSRIQNQFTELAIGNANGIFFSLSHSHSVGSIAEKFYELKVE